MKYSFFFAATFITTLIFSTACSKDRAPDPIPFECADTTISYSLSIEPLVIENCATSGCHGNSAAGGYRLDSYEKIEQHKFDIITVIKHEDGLTPMPLGAPKLSITQIQSFVCWVEQGAPNN